LIKGSKDSSLASNENLSKMLLSIGWALGQCWVWNILYLLRCLEGVTFHIEWLLMDQVT